MVNPLKRVITQAITLFPMPIAEHALIDNKHPIYSRVIHDFLTQ